MKDKVIEEFDCGCVMSNPELEDGHTLWRLCKDHGDLIFKLVTEDKETAIDRLAKFIRRHIKYDKSNQTCNREKGRHKNRR